MLSEKINTTILVAPLDWGLGHATRCVPLISQLVKLGCKVIIAAEGAQEKLLKTEFPDLAFINIRGYRINYSKNKRFFSLKIIGQLPKIALAIKREKKWLEELMSHTHIDAIISDNRYGLVSSALPTIFITHQLSIKAPFLFAEKLLQRINYILIKRFSACWVPDEKGCANMAGVLSHPRHLPKIPVQYLGGLSRLTKVPEHQKEYDLLAIVSGPEPQRTLLEKKILQELHDYRGRVLLVRGLPGNVDVLPEKENWTITNHLPAKQLEAAFSKSDLIISRSGYTTVMDIFKLQKKSVLIPTPGQTEQEYLANHLQQQGWCISIAQEDFSLNELLKRLQSFEYNLPTLDMEFYKVIVTKFINDLKA